MKKFKDLGLIEPILKAIEEEKFEEPTDIQAKSIPSVLKGKDVLAGSATGSGKTLAFAAGLIQNSKRGKGIQGLVLTPTRELAEQIYKVFKTFTKYKELTIAKIYGGVAIDPQIHKLKKADIVIGTPGRILDHLTRKTLSLTKVKTLVLDEADRMLDMGFIDDIEKIIRRCPKDRQTLLYSATISGLLGHIIKKHLKNPVKIEVESYVDPSKLKQIYYDVPDNLKFALLLKLLKKEKKGLVMVFCNTRNNVDFVAKNLEKHGIEAQPIHGGFTQSKRNKSMENFHSEKAKILVCTDVAARGLDIPHVSHVYNYDAPSDSKEYVHRIGRTARAGKEGMAVNILGPRDHDNFGRVLMDNDIEIEKEETPKLERVKLYLLTNLKKKFKKKKRRY